MENKTNSASITNGFHLVVDAMKLNGLDTIYGVAGIPVTDLARLAQAEGIRYIGFHHEQSAGNAAAIAGYLTQKPGICLTVSAPGFLNGLVALANATTNGFPMIQISGSSDRATVDLQQGEYEELDQMNAAKPYAKAAYRVDRAEDIGIGLARAIRAAVSGRPGGVYLDLPGDVLAATLDAETGARSLVRVVDPAPRQLPDSGSGPARPGRARPSGAAAHHPRQGRGVRAGGRRHPRIHREDRHPLPAHVHGQGPAARRPPAIDGGGPIVRPGERRRRDVDRRAAELAAEPWQSPHVVADGAVHSARHHADGDRQQPAPSLPRWWATSPRPSRPCWRCSSPARSSRVPPG